MSFISAFIGVPQSRYAAIAVLLAILAISLTILLGNDPIPLSQKFAFIFMIFLVSLPGLLLSLFQLTCIVVGAGKNNQRPWCSIYAWIVSALLIIYCALLIVLAITSLTSRSKALGEVAMADAEKFIDLAKANGFAAEAMMQEHFTGGNSATAVGNSSAPGSTVAPPPADIVAGAAAQNADPSANLVPGVPAMPPQKFEPKNPAQFTNQKFHNQEHFAGAASKPQTPAVSGGFHNQEHFATQKFAAQKFHGQQHFTNAPKQAAASGGFHTQEHFASTPASKFTNQNRFTNAPKQAAVSGGFHNQEHFAAQKFHGQQHFTNAPKPPAPPNGFHNQEHFASTPASKFATQGAHSLPAPFPFDGVEKFSPLGKDHNAVGM